MTLSSGKIAKYEYLTGEEILPTDQSQLIQQTEFAYSPLKSVSKTKFKQLKVKEELTVEVLKVLKPAK